MCHSQLTEYKIGHEITMHRTGGNFTFVLKYKVLSNALGDDCHWLWHNVMTAVWAWWWASGGPGLCHAVTESPGPLSVITGDWADSGHSVMF